MLKAGATSRTESDFGTEEYRSVDNRNRSNDRVAILSAIDSPLSYFSLCGLIVESLLLGISTFTDKISTWVPAVIFIVLILVVFIMALVDPDALYGRFPVIVHIHFQSDNRPNPDAFESQNCYLVVHRYPRWFRRGGTDREDITLNKSPGSDGFWHFYLPRKIKHPDTVSLELNSSGKRWQVGSFDPYQTQQEAHFIDEQR